jgi:hypothetical protein
MLAISVIKVTMPSHTFEPTERAFPDADPYSPRTDRRTDETIAW